MNRSLPALRPDLAHIARWINPGSRVLDLGCGDGELLAYLRDAQQVDGIGVEIDPACVPRCVTRRVPIIQQNLEGGLALFSRHMFDTVVLSQTVQAMHHTEQILREMARVGRRGIVSFPNFGHWRHAWSLLRGRMPVTPQIPYEWYDTPNIHLCTLADFEKLAHRVGLRILNRAVLAHGRTVRLWPSGRATLAIYHFSGEEAGAKSAAG